MPGRVVPRRRIVLWSFVILPMLPGPGQPSAQIRIDIDSPGGQGLPIAVAPLESGNGQQGRRLAERFSAVVARDLELSGLFRVLDETSHVEGPGRVLQADIDFGRWSVLGAAAIIKGKLRVRNADVTIESRLFDVVQHAQMGGKRYLGSPAEVRGMAHRFADETMRLLTGEAGPFNSRIAFVSRRGEGHAKNVYIMDLSGADVKKLTTGRTLNLGPSWSPTGEQLLYISYKQGGPYPFIFGLDSGRETRLYAMVAYGGSWSPDGRWIALSLEQRGNSDLFLVTPAGKLIRRLTDNPGIDVSPSWSPDGREIAFCSNRGGGPQIYKLNVLTGRIRRVTFSGTYNTSPVWSPTGDRIAYTARSGGFRVRTVAVDGSDPLEIAAGEHPSWAPDGRYLVFGHRGRLMMAGRDGRIVKQLTGGRGDDTSPSWSPRLQ